MATIFHSKPKVGMTPGDKLRLECIRAALSTGAVETMVDVMVSIGELPKKARWLTLTEPQLKRVLKALQAKARRDRDQ